MKTIVIGGLTIAVILGIVRFLSNPLPMSDNKPQVNLKTQITKPVTDSAPSRSIFVPYWASEVNGGSFDTFYYFGIRPTKQGTIENEVGYQKISLMNGFAEKQKKLVLNMLDLSVTEVLLGNKTTQLSLISEVSQLLSTKEFSGLILDVEIPFTLQSNKKEQITQFVQLMCTEIKSDYKTCGVLIYGDFSYRNRPYDLKKLGEVADTILLMAYDFHKAGGEPGPNFPLSRRSPALRDEGGPSTIDYGYDFKQMITDATALVPKEKIEVVFGMYGYDWTMNEQGTPLMTAKALSLNEIQALNSNSNSNSKTPHVTSYMLRINNALEKNIRYSDGDGRVHVIWYEDEESANLKIKYLQEHGISKISYWAYGYY